MSTRATIYLPDATTESQQKWGEQYRRDYDMLPFLFFTG